MRAARDNFHPIRQTFDRIHSLDIMGHEIDKTAAESPATELQQT